MLRSLQYFRMRRNLRDRLRQHHDQRQLAIGGQPVALEGAHLVDRVDHAFARHDDAHVGDDLVAPPHRLGIGLGHRQAGHRSPRRKLVKTIYQFPPRMQFKSPLIQPFGPPSCIAAGAPLPVGERVACASSRVRGEAALYRSRCKLDKLIDQFILFPVSWRFHAECAVGRNLFQDRAFAHRRRGRAADRGADPRRRPARRRPPARRARAVAPVRRVAADPARRAEGPRGARPADDHGMAAAPMSPT